MNSGSKIRWGLVGCGQIAIDKSLPGLLAAKNACLVAIADPLESRRALALDRAGQSNMQPTAYQDLHELLADPGVDAVYVALPTGMHKNAVIAAAKAKKAILCEKPLGNSAAEVREMVRAARENGVPLMTGYMSRFSDVFQKAAQLVREGAIGKVTYVAANFSYPCSKYYPPGKAGGWRYTDELGGGPLLDVGIYLVFGIREMLGERIARVASLNRNTHAPEGSVISDTTISWFETEKGTPGTLVTSFSHAAQYINFFGTQGNLMVSDCFYQTPGARLECVTGDGNTPLILDTKTEANLAHFDNYRREFEHFSAALLQKTPHSPSEDDVLSDALLLDTLKKNADAIDVPSLVEFLN